MVVGLQGIRVAGLRFIGRIRQLSGGERKNSFSEADPTPTRYTGPKAKAGSVIKTGEKNFPIQKFGIAVRKAGSEALRR